MVVSEKVMKVEIATHKRTNKALSTRLIAAERKAKELKEELQFEVASSKEVVAKRISLEQRVNLIAKVLMEDGVKLTPSQLKACLKKATKQGKLWASKNAKLAANKLKLESQEKTLQAWYEVL